MDRGHTDHRGTAGQSYITLQLLYIKGIQAFYTIENTTNTQKSKETVILKQNYL